MASSIANLNNFLYDGHGAHCSKVVQITHLAHSRRGTLRLFTNDINCFNLNWHYSISWRLLRSIRSSWSFTLRAYWFGGANRASELVGSILKWVVQKCFFPKLFSLLPPFECSLLRRIIMIFFLRNNNRLWLFFNRDSNDFWCHETRIYFF